MSRALALVLGTLGLGVGLLTRQPELQPVESPAYTPEAAEPPAVEPAPPDDPLPEGAERQFGSPRFQLRSAVRALAFSPDGKRLAAMTDSALDLWDTATGLVVESHPTYLAARFLRWTADDRIVAVSHSAGAEFVMQTFTPGKPLAVAARNQLGAALELPPGAGRARNWLPRLAFAPDGRSIVALRTARLTSNGLWSVWAERYPFHDNEVSTRVAHASSFRLATATGMIRGAWLSSDGAVFFCLSDTLNGKEMQLQAYDALATGDGSPPWTLTFAGVDREPMRCLSHDGRAVILHFKDGAVERWDGPRGVREREFPPVRMTFDHDTGDFASVHLSADGRRLTLLPRHEDGTVECRVVDAKTGNDLTKPRPLAAMLGNRGAVLSVDGRTLARHGGAIRLWNTRTGAEKLPLPGHRGPVYSLAVLPNGNVVTSGGGTVRAWNPDTGEERWRADAAGGVDHVTADAVIANVYREPELRREAVVIDLRTGRRLPLQGDLGRAKFPDIVAVSPDGKKVVTRASNGRSSGMINWPNKTVVESASWDVWSWPDGKHLLRLPIPSPKEFMFSFGRSARFTPDGHRLVTVSGYDKIELLFRSGSYSSPPPFTETWDLETGKLLEQEQMRREEDHPPHLLVGGQRLDCGNGVDPTPVLPLAFSADGKRVAAVLTPYGQSPTSTGKQIRVHVFDAHTGKRLRALETDGPVRALAFLPDGRLVTAADVATVWRKQ